MSRHRRQRNMAEACAFCTHEHPEDTSCILPEGVPAWVLWRFKDEAPVTRCFPCASQDDAAFWASAILDEFGADAFDSGHHRPRVTTKRVEQYPKGRARILRLMQLD